MICVYLFGYVYAEGSPHVIMIMIGVHAKSCFIMMPFNGDLFLVYIDWTKLSGTCPTPRQLHDYTIIFIIV